MTQTPHALGVHARTMHTFPVVQEGVASWMGLVQGNPGNPTSTVLMAVASPPRLVADCSAASGLPTTALQNGEGACVTVRR